MFRNFILLFKSAIKIEIDKGVLCWHYCLVAVAIEETLTYFYVAKQRAMAETAELPIKHELGIDF